MTAAQKARSRERSYKRQQCREKRTWPNVLVAMAVCERLRLEGHAKRNPLTVYECGTCGGIHIGHLGKGESILMYGPYSEDVRQLQTA